MSSVENNGGNLDEQEKKPNEGLSGVALHDNHWLKKFLAAPYGNLPRGINYITLAVSGLLFWALLYAFLERDVEPGGQLFQLFALTILSYFCGWLISLLHLPPLLGMLLCGIGLRNLGFFDVFGIYAEIVGKIREVALTTVLLHAGLGLDPKALKKLSFVVIRLAFIPCLAETIGTAVAIRYVLHMPWIWGFLLGAVLSAVSPAVLIPSLLAIKEKGYGENKGISTLVIAACSLDDIVAISMFGVILGMIFSDETSSVDFEQKLLQGPLEAGIGFVVGVGWGIVAACFPHCKEKYLVVKRSFMVGGGGLALVLWSTRFGYPGSGPLATIVSSFIAQIYWKKQGWSDEYNPVEVVVNTLWSVMQPLLFGLIGTEIKFEIIQLSLIGQGMAVLAFGSVVRVISCSLALVGSNLNLKETIFVNLAWLPKATVQATLGPLVLDSVIRAGRDDLLSYAQIILTITVLSILVTAPVGAIGISLGGPRLLSHKSVEASRKYSTANDQNTNVT